MGMDELSDLIGVEFQPQALTSGRGVLEGKRLGPRDVAKLAHGAGWRDDAVFTAVQVCGAESWLFTRAHNDNIDDENGVVKSRDVGLWEINIPASLIGTQAEFDLYDPETNAARAFALWKQRGWQPWAAFNSGVYLHDVYTAWGLLGTMNRLAEQNRVAQRASGYTTQLRVPFVSLPEARKLYPGVMIG